MQDKKEEGGLYFDGREVALACTAGTQVWAKLANAFTKCFEATGAEFAEIVADGAADTPPSTEATAVVNRRRKCKGRNCKKNSNKKCPSVQDIKEKIGFKMEGTQF